MTFIYFCKFKSLAPIPKDLQPICNGKPEASLINTNDSIDRIIQKLKDDGRNYSHEHFLRLLQIIGQHNIINIKFDKPEVSSISRLLHLIESINKENHENIDKPLRELIKNAFDTFEIASEQTTKEIKDLNNFLLEENEEMKEELIEFIHSNAEPDIKKRRSFNKTIRFIQNLSLWATDNSTRNEDIKISNDKMYNIINFYKTFIENFAIVFPNIILNKVDHDNLLIAKYQGFSTNHSNKLKKNIRNIMRNYIAFMENRYY
jgi:hypothetical protein